MSSLRSSEQGVYVTLPELIALRAQAKREPWFAYDSSRTTMPGEHRSRERGRGVEFEEVRPYQPGDDIRRIDWRTTARKGLPYTKLFTEEREQSVYLAVDQRASLFFGSGRIFKSVMAAHTAAIIGWSAVQSGFRLSGTVLGESITTTNARSSQRALLQLLHATAEANRRLSAHAVDAHSLSQLLESCINHAKRGSTVVVVSDFSDWNDKASVTLQQLSRNYAVRLLRIIDALEDKLPKSAQVSISDGLTQSTVALDASSRRDYQVMRQQFSERIEADCQHFGVQQTVLYTSDEIGYLWSRAANGG